MCIIICSRGGTYVVAVLLLFNNLQIDYASKASLKYSKCHLGLAFVSAEGELEHFLLRSRSSLDVNYSLRRLIPS
jgi:hypothetical protein